MLVRGLRVLLLDIQKKISNVNFLFVSYVYPNVMEQTGVCIVGTLLVFFL
jgi:hypothetical protein